MSAARFFLNRVRGRAVRQFEHALNGMHSQVPVELASHSPVHVSVRTSGMVHHHVVKAQVGKHRVLVDDVEVPEFGSNTHQNKHNSAHGSSHVEKLCDLSGIIVRFPLNFCMVRRRVITAQGSDLQLKTALRDSREMSSDVDSSDSENLSHEEVKVPKHNSLRQPAAYNKPVYSGHGSSRTMTLCGLGGVGVRFPFGSFLGGRTLVTLAHEPMEGREAIAEKVARRKKMFGSSGNMELVRKDPSDKTGRLERPLQVAIGDLNAERDGVELCVISADPHAKILHGREYPVLKRGQLSEAALDLDPIPLSADAVNLVKIGPGTPFDIQGNPDKIFIWVLTDGAYFRRLGQVPTFEELHNQSYGFNIRRHQKVTPEYVQQLWNDVALLPYKHDLTEQQLRDGAEYKEKFGKEDTAPDMRPNSYRPTSRTSMNFNDRFEIPVDVNAEVPPEEPSTSTDAHKHDSGGRNITSFLAPTFKPGDKNIKLSGVLLCVGDPERNPYQVDEMVFLLDVPGRVSKATFSCVHEFRGERPLKSYHPHDADKVRKALEESRYDPFSKGALEYDTRLVKSEHMADRPDMTRLMHKAYVEKLVYELDDQNKPVLDEDNNLKPVYNIFRFYQDTDGQLRLVPKVVLEAVEASIKPDAMEHITYRELVDASLAADKLAAVKELVARQSPASKLDNVSKEAFAAIDGRRTIR